MPLDNTHFDHLIHLLGLEDSAQRAHLEALRHTLTLEQQALQGITLVDLEAVDERIGLVGRVLIDFESAHRGQDIAGRIKPGDPVRVRERRGEQNVDGVIASRSRFKITVAFAEPPAEWVSISRVNIDLMPDATTIRHARNACITVRDARRGANNELVRAREWLLETRSPTFLGPAVAPGDENSDLNPEQLNALDRAMRSNELFLLHGPPGTGKTAVLARIAHKAVQNRARVVATAASNAAVDNLALCCAARGLNVVRVGHPARVSEAMHPRTLDALVSERAERDGVHALFEEAWELLGYARRQRRQGRGADRYANAREATARGRTLLDEARAAERKITEYVLDHADVVCATLSGLATLEPRPFDLALLDEATQAIEPTSLWAIIRAERVVMAGDHKQLPPTVISEQAAREGLSVSLFERMITAHGDTARVMLREQYRMNEKIMELPSRAFYDNALRAHPSAAHRSLHDLGVTTLFAQSPVVFVDTSGRGWDEDLATGTESRHNEGEAGLIVRRIKALLDAGLTPEHIAIITPYAAQVLCIRNAVRAAELPDALEIDSVDAFQGREKDVVLISLVRSNTLGEIGFVKDLRRINVAITRARRQVFVVGDGATLGRHQFLASLIDHAQQCNGYYSVWEWPGEDFDT